MSTTARVLIGLALGILAGVLSTLAGDDFAARLAALVSPVGTLWLNALRMTVVPLVVSLVIVGVTDASSAAAAGRATSARARVVHRVACRGSRRNGACRRPRSIRCGRADR